MIAHVEDTGAGTPQRLQAINGRGPDRRADAREPPCTCERGHRRQRAAVDHETAAKWISPRAPLKALASHCSSLVEGYMLSDNLEPEQAAGIDPK